MKPIDARDGQGLPPLVWTFLLLALALLAAALAPLWLLPFAAHLPHGDALIKLYGHLARF